MQIGLLANQCLVCEIWTLNTQKFRKYGRKYDPDLNNNEKYMNFKYYVAERNGHIQKYINLFGVHGGIVLN